MTNRCYIFDLDGTLADLTHRLHFIQQKPKDWKSFFAAVGDDKPVPHMVEIFSQLNRYQTIICTGRPEETKYDTIEWLKKWDLRYDALYMRPSGDYRADAILKQELLTEILRDGFDPMIAFDDRQRVVDMWRSNGIPCAQVAPGDF